MKQFATSKNNVATVKNAKVITEEFDMSIEPGLDISEDLVERIRIAVEDYVENRLLESSNFEFMNDLDYDAYVKGVIDYLDNQDQKLFYKYQFNNDYTLMDLTHEILMDYVGESSYDEESYGYHLVA